MFFNILGPFKSVLMIFAAIESVYNSIILISKSTLIKLIKFSNPKNINFQEWCPQHPHKKAQAVETKSCPDLNKKQITRFRKR